MRNTIIALAAVIVLAVTQGCSMFNSVDKNLVAYGIGKAITAAYLKEKGNLSQQEQDIAVKVWVAFRDNLDQFKGKEAKDLPVYLKECAGQYIPIMSMRDKASSLIDQYWAAMDSQFGVNSMNVDEMVSVLASLRDGIQSSLPQDKVMREFAKKAQSVK